MRGNGMAVMNTTIFVSTTLLSLLMFLLTYFRVIGEAMVQAAAPRGIDHRRDAYGVVGAAAKWPRRIVLTACSVVPAFFTGGNREYREKISLCILCCLL